jgi:hypothetical protein
MNPIINKEQLLAVVTKNMNGHRDLFLKAVDGYQIEAIKMLKEHISAIKADKLYPIMINLPVPEDHTKDYERVVKMIEMDKRNDIELTEQEFKMYVMDDWNWKDQWTTSNFAYLNSTV